MKHTPVEVEVMVPCAEGREHPVRLRIHSWNKWELAYTPCEDLLGRGFALMAPCSHYVHENSDSLAHQIIQQLAQMGAQAVPLLIEVLHEEYEEEDILYAAVEALGEIGDPRAVPALIDALEASDWDLRTAVVCALGEIGDPQAIPVLIELLQLDILDVLQEDIWNTRKRYRVEELRCAAAYALGMIGDPQAVPALIDALGEWDEDLRRAAARALGAIGDPQAAPALRVHAELLDTARQALEQLGKADYPLEQAVQELEQQGRLPVMLHVLTAAKVQDAMATLNPSSVSTLCHLAKEGLYHYPSCYSAVSILGALRHPDAISALISFIQQTLYYDSASLNDLRNELPDYWDGHDYDEFLTEMCASACEALGELGDAQAVPALIQALGNWSEDVRKAAAEALGKLGDAQAVPALQKALSDRSKYVRQAAQAALDQIRARQQVQTGGGTP